MKLDKPFLSLIIPAYKQQRTIKKDIIRIKDIMDHLRIDYELIVVVDGEIDNTRKEAKEIRSPKVHVVGYQHNHGKGYAVRFGMAQAKGNIIAFIDAGMDINPNSLSILLEQFEWYQADILIGSKLHPGSKVNYPWQRKILSIGYRTVVKLLFGLSVRDTQVGLKLYKRKVLEDVLPRLLVKHHAFDIELLAVAYRLGYKRIIEGPVNIDFNNSSSITSKNFWKVVWLMMWDTVAVFYRMKILKYYDNGNNRKWRYDPELNFRVNVV
ncbi:MAG TPA: glycosyltransferase [Candidatus Saccharimonadales bacterium]|nr:glycosyltransferase [Candidatus Saccharimonadales bacterium]